MISSQGYQRPYCHVNDTLSFRRSLHDWEILDFSLRSKWHFLIDMTLRMNWGFLLSTRCLNPTSGNPWMPLAPTWCHIPLFLHILTSRRAAIMICSDGDEIAASISAMTRLTPAFWIVSRNWLTSWAFSSSKMICNYSGSKFRGSRFKVRCGFILLAISRNMKSASQSAVNPEPWTLNREPDNLNSYINFNVSLIKKGIQRIIIWS